MFLTVLSYILTLYLKKSNQKQQINSKLVQIMKLDEGYYC